MDDVDTFGLIATIASPVFLGLLQTVKKFPKLERFIFPLSLLLGVVVFVSMKYVLDINAPIKFFVITGLIEGLAASGLWSGAKDITKKFFPDTYVKLYNKE